MSEKNLNRKHGCLGLIILILIIGFISDKFGCNDNTTVGKKEIRRTL